MVSKVFAVYSSGEVLEFTRKCVKDVEGIEGALIECGVGAGSQLAVMAETSDKRVIGFDSFNGIPYAGKHDTSQPGIGDIDKTRLGELKTTGITVHPIANVRDNFDKWGVRQVELVEGWFQDTIPSFEIDKISLLRLDGDLYESTRIPLKYFYKKVQKGGIIIIDDWQLTGCRKACKEIIKEEIIETMGIAYCIKK